jgi:hypothetical protein
MNFKIFEYIGTAVFCSEKSEASKNSITKICGGHAGFLFLKLKVSAGLAFEF